MLKKIPIAAAPIYPREVLSSFEALFEKAEIKNRLKAQFSQFIDKRYLFFLNSGLASFYVILEALKVLFQKEEVILPAYTASSLIIAVKKAGLKPVLCDISLSDFNMDVRLLPTVVKDKTLCITGVHMFGIVNRGIAGLKERFSDVFIVEDSAQSLGSKINGIPVGGLGDASFFSFNRGKNLPTYGGGCIATDSEPLARKIEEKLQDLKEDNLLFNFLIPFKILALSLAASSYFYGLFYDLISIFKEKPPSEDPEIKKYANPQTAVLLSLLEKIEEFSKKRYDNGMKLIEALKDIKDIIVPKIAEDTQPAFNRLPIMFEDLKMKERAKSNLWKAGVETSSMYYKPLHHIFNLGYKKSDFPNAVYFAEHVLTLPIHPLVKQEDLSRIINVIKSS